MKDHSTALSYFDKTLETLRKSFLSDHPKMAIVYNEIGDLYQSIEDYKTALLFYKKTLEIRQKSLPSNHPDLAQIYNELGMFYKLMEDHPTALTYFKESLAIQTKSLQQDHTDIVTSAMYILSVTELNDLPDTFSYVEKIFDAYLKKDSSY
jgi:tetratricopeptide (TPR) repeat protein